MQKYTYEHHYTRAKAADIFSCGVSSKQITLPMRSLQCDLPAAPIMHLIIRHPQIIAVIAKRLLYPKPLLLLKGKQCNTLAVFNKVN